MEGNRITWSEREHGEGGLGDRGPRIGDCETSGEGGEQGGMEGWRDGGN